MMTAWQMSKQIPVQWLGHDLNHCIGANTQMVDFFLWLVRIFCYYSLECCDQTSWHVSQLYTWSDWKGPRHPKANNHFASKSLYLYFLCVCVCACVCVVCVLVCAPVQDVFKGCGGVPCEPMWAPPAGRRYSVIRPIDSTRAQKRRKCGAAVFGALFLTHPPSNPANRCLLKWTLKTYLIIWVTPVLTLPANDYLAQKFNRSMCLNLSFWTSSVLQKMSFLRASSLEVLKMAHCTVVFFRNWERRGCVKKVTTFITGWLRVWGKKIWMGLFQILSVHELHDQSEMIHCNFPALRPIKRYNNSGWPSSHLLVWSITGSYWRQEITLDYVQW